MITHILKPVWRGVVTQDIVTGSNVLNVRPLEPLPSNLGEVTWFEDPISTTVEINGTEETIEINSGSGIDCNWLNRNSNRMTPPDVMKGERVLVWRNGDSEDYFWESIDTDNHLRTVEHIVIAISNTNKEDRADKTLSRENCYLIELDTINKKVGLYTNRNDGEPFAYNIELDTAIGKYKVEDDVGNHILLDSENTVIELLNKEMTRYRMDKKDILEECLGNRVLKVGGTNTVEIGGASTTTIGGNDSVTVSGTGMYKSNGYTIDSPTTTITGDVTINGALLGESGMTTTTTKSDSVTSDSITSKAIEVDDLVIKKSVAHP